MPPSTQLINAVRTAAEEPIIDAGARLGASHSNWPFLPPSSSVIDRKAIGFVSALFKKTNPASAQFSSQFDELAEYLALSTCCHALDGWRYLSQAALAILSGARNEALHLAYYAELRAALSILAGSGIGVLKKEHFSLTTSPTIEWFEGPTHVTAWKALVEWSNVPSNALKVIECLGVLNISAEEWAEACGAAANKQGIAENWLTNWSIDLNALFNDRDARNEASYRPDLRCSALVPLDWTEIQFICDVNSSCIPLGSGQFQSVDLALVYDLCASASTLKYLPTDKLGLRRLWNGVFRWLVNEKRLGKKEAFAILRDIQNAPHTSAGKILQLADTTNTETVGVFSRAFLLLRLASALVRRQWQKMQRVAATRTTSRGLIDWQEKLLASYALYSNLWDGSSRLNNYDILDADREWAQEQLDVWIRTHRSSPAMMWKDSSIPSSLFQLCRLERVAVMAASL
jgi:hypothetical protein